jgi:hypothetical protein
VGRSTGLIAHPVFVGVIDGIWERVSPVISWHSPVLSAYAPGRFSRAVGSIGTSNRLSSLALEVVVEFVPLVAVVRALEEAVEAPPKLDRAGPWPEEAEAEVLSG